MIERFKIISTNSFTSEDILRLEIGRMGHRTVPRLPMQRRVDRTIMHLEFFMRVVAIIADVQAWQHILSADSNLSAE